MTEDMIKKKFGRLTVKKFNGIKIRVYNGKTKRSREWVCECECGEVVITDTAHLKRGHTKSCGCLKRDLQRKEKTMSGKVTVWCSMRNSAKKRKLEWSLEFDYFVELCSGLCHYCGAGCSNVCRHLDDWARFEYNGIDRVNNNLGYIIGNVVTCCEMCNKFKNAHMEEAFLNHVKKIYEFQERQQNETKC